MKAVEKRVETVETADRISSMRAQQRPVVCRDCGDDVATHTTVNGKTILLEFGAWEDGNVIIVDGLAVVLGRNDPRRFDGRVLLMPHAAKCRARIKRPA